MIPQETIRQLSEALIIGPKKVFDLLEILLQEDSHPYNSLTLLKAQYRYLVLAKMHNTLSESEAHTQWNQLNEKILIFINLLEVGDLKSTLAANELPTHGEVLYRIPTQMSIGIETHCIIRIAPTNAILLRNFSLRPDDKVREDILLAEIMEVEILNDSENGPFKVRALSDPIQPIHTKHYTEWVFAVTPLRIGEYPLTLRISTLLLIQGKDLRQNTVLEERIFVSSENVHFDAEFLKSSLVVAYSLQLYPSFEEQGKLADSISLPSGRGKQLPANYWYRSIAFAIFLMVAGISSVVAFNIYQDQKDWRETVANGDIEAYKAYRRKHPTGKYIQQALDSIKIIPIPPGTSPENIPNQESSGLHSLDDPSYWAVLKGGDFKMGSVDGSVEDACLHVETVQDFSIARFEVTQALWRDIMKTNPSRIKGCDSCPVEQVSWNEVQDFIKRIRDITGRTYRLPTEKEWEYAAFRGKEGVDYAGEAFSWSTLNSNRTTHPIGEKRPNSLMIYDLTGNVAEWCSNNYQPYINCRFQTFRPNSKIVRGGAFSQGVDVFQISYRQAFPANTSYSYVGFRLVMDK